MIQRDNGRETERDPLGVAVIGMAGRFPGARNIDELWRNLAAGVESIEFFAPEAIDPSVPASVRSSPDYVPARGILSGADEFDAAFFGISKREAELMDPQNRIFLQTAWEALEASGHCPGEPDGLVGVYAGMANNSYFATSVLPRPDLVALLGEFQTMLANEKDFLATRVSHKLDLTGPSISVHTGCSTSLVAINQAFHSLLSFQCDVALAGGVCITCPQNTGYIYREDGIEARDGHCRPFDASATGTVFSNGVGIVVLKRLEDALADGDSIRAVIRGTALNNDGAAKVSFAAPSAQGQADVIAMAHAQAGIEPSTVTYVEAHGTATRLGDPIEFEGLKRAFQYPRHGHQYCAIGSIKSNFGHLLAAAGVAGFIKTVLALEHRQIPPSLHFETPNPAIDFAASPFFVNTSLKDWDAIGSPRRAGVSSFGIGGTNAHVVLEEAPTVKVSEPPSSPQLLVLSARNEAALRRATNQMARHLGTRTDANLGDVAYTLQTGRRSFPHRLIAAVTSPSEAAESLPADRSENRAVATCHADDPQVVFVFPGQGTQYPLMGTSLYRNAPVFRSAVDRCAQILGANAAEDAAIDVVDLLYSPDTTATTLTAPRPSQLAIFVTEYALAQALLSWGITPKALIGYSVGELVAACVSGVVSVDDALRLLASRGEALEAVEPGRMLSVRLPAAELEKALVADSYLAADNAPNLSVASGTIVAIGELERKLATAGVAVKDVAVAHPFHTDLLSETIAAVLPVCAGMRFSRPRIPMISTVTGNWFDPHDLTDPTYWARHPCRPVQFRQAVATMAASGTGLVLEVGGGTTLAGCVRLALRESTPIFATSTLPDEWTGANEEWIAVLMAVGRLWQHGVAIKWHSTHPQGRRRISLPTYPFEQTRFWLEAVARSDWLARGDDRPA